VAHNPNTIEAIDAAISNGANALEPDITMVGLLSGAPDPGPIARLVDYDSSAPFRPGRDSDTKFIDWLDKAHSVAVSNPGRLALIIFDMKTTAATAPLGSIILDMVRTRLNTNGVKIPIILSVGSTSDAVVFQNIYNRLGPLEGVQVDGASDPGSVIAYFAQQKYVRNIAVSDGGAQADYDLVLPTGAKISDQFWADMDYTAYLRAKNGLPKSLPYLYVFHRSSSQNEIITSGEDGIIPDVLPDFATLSYSSSGFENPVFDPSYVSQLAAIVRGRGDVRIATTSDNPFQPLNEAYTFAITTSTDSGSGTDALLQFRLKGANGSSTIVIDSSRGERMESGKTDYVTIPSRDLGTLNVLEIANLGPNPLGNAAWTFSRIEIFSAKWLSPISGGYYYELVPQGSDGVIHDHQVSGYGLTPINNSGLYHQAYAAASPPSEDPPDGSQAHPWQDLFPALNYLNTSGNSANSIHLGQGTYNDIGRIALPCRISRSPDSSSGAARIVGPGSF
jgi:hypothetical protein